MQEVEANGTFFFKKKGSGFAFILQNRLLGDKSYKCMLELGVLCMFMFQSHEQH